MINNRVIQTIPYRIERDMRWITRDMIPFQKSQTKSDEDSQFYRNHVLGLLTVTPSFRCSLRVPPKRNVNEGKKLVNCGSLTGRKSAYWPWRVSYSRRTRFPSCYVSLFLMAEGVCCEIGRGSSWEWSYGYVPVLLLFTCHHSRRTIRPYETENPCLDGW